MHRDLSVGVGPSELVPEPRGAVPGQVVDADLDKFAQHEEKHPGLKRARGHVGLQSHDGRVEFRTCIGDFQ